MKESAGERMDIMNYINKLCKAADRKIEQKRKQSMQGKKYCKNFIKGQDGYCINYTGARPCVMTCSVQCKVKQFDISRKLLPYGE